MARTLRKPFELMRVEGVPVMVTVKTVKNINLRVKPDVINISAPPQVSRKTIRDAVEQWLPTIHKELEEYREEARNTSRFLMYLDGKSVKYTFNSEKNQFTSTVEGDSIFVEFPTLFEKFPTEALKAYVQKHAESIIGKSIATENEKAALESVLLYGKRHPIVFTENSNCIFCSGGNLYIPESIYSVREQIDALDRYLTGELVACIEDTLRIWEPVVKESIVDLQIKKYKSKWASIKPKTGQLNVNFYLICAPRESIEATILHELCHFHHFGHQKDFYEELLRYMPDYHDRDDKLKKINLPIEYYTIS